jgi:voltage-gated potassium channel
VTDGKLQVRVWATLEPVGEASRLARIVGGVIATVILLAVTATVLQSERALATRYRPAFITAEVAFLTIFAVEYALRLWAAGADPRYQGVRGRLRWALTFWAVVDVLAILPGLLWWLDVDLRFVRAVRLIRLFRLGRYSRGLRMLATALRASGRQLTVAFSGVLVLLLFASVALYYAERSMQPDAFGSIPSAMWWGVCTLTTVGYGDVVPITTVGRILAGGIAVLGVGTFAVPAGILAATFEQSARAEAEAKARCPHCGEPLLHASPVTGSPPHEGA